MSARFVLLWLLYTLAVVLANLAIFGEPMGAMGWLAYLVGSVGGWFLGGLMAVRAARRR